MSTMRGLQPILLGLTLLGLAACGRKDAEAQLPPAAGATAAPLPRLPKIEAGSSALTSSDGRTTGTTYPREEAQLGPNVSGIITDLPLKEGDRVKKGDVVFRQDTRDALLRVEQAKVGLEAARVQLKAMETELQRSKALLDQNAISRAQWDQIEPRYEGAKIGVRQAEVGLEMAQKYFADSSVRAPFDGVVTAKIKNQGEMATIMPPTVVLILQNQSVLEVRFKLAERALSVVKPGDRVDVHFSALGVSREATVSRISPAVDSRTRTVEMVAELPNEDGSLRPGLLAEVSIKSIARAEAASGDPR